MRVWEPPEARAIEHFGSHGFLHTRIARGDVQVSKVALDGVIGGHEAASKQLLIVLAGRVEVATTDERLQLGAGEAVEWGEGEWHETRSLEPSILLLVEGAFE
jgi:mannose-6-phosphate isomerase-like protein (cupin superfamily)